MTRDDAAAPAPAPRAGGVEDLARLLRGRRVVALTGAGCSTESGIPDYRGPETRRRARRPLEHKEFVSDPAARRRYWARSFVGWPRFAAARPNPAHAALARLEVLGALAGVITQNVDRLHHVGGSRRVVELHGTLHEVECLDCGAREPRAAVQGRLAAANPGFAARGLAHAPDGDAELAPEDVETFRPVGCRACDGSLKPAVVFFGGVVPRAVREEAGRLLGEAEALLVVGSSLAVFSGYRFVREAGRLGLPVAIVDLGETRGDPDAALKVTGRAGEVLPALAGALGA